MCGRDLGGRLNPMHETQCNAFPSWGFAYNAWWGGALYAPQCTIVESMGVFPVHSYLHHDRMPECLCPWRSG